MLVTAVTLLTYSVGLTLASGAIKKGCNNKATKNIEAKIAALPENHTEEDELKIVKSESIKSMAKYSTLTALAGVAGAAVSTAVIYNFDNNTCCDNTPEPEEIPEVNTTMIGDVEVTTF